MTPIPTKKIVMRLTGYFPALILFCLTGISFTYGQCMLTPVSLNDRIQLSSSIVEGKVIAQSSFWNSTGTLIYTANTVEVYKDFKANVNAQQIQLITEGGTWAVASIS